ncbi:putative lipoprotein YerB [Clostridia bacterium]|nr:putative lipoprotein YerB [Clostridia bacterium]
MKKKVWKLMTLAMVFALALGGCAPAPDVIPPEEPPPPVVLPEAEPEPEPEPVPTYPLTGLEAPNEMAPHVRTLSIKIENTPEAKPQLGITRADVVYETVTEGGITRFNCLFQSDIPDEVGPVRSARDSDMSIVPEYNALFFFSGTNSLVWARLGTTTINEMNHSSAPQLYHRVNFRAAPHDLFLDLTTVYEAAEEMGYQPGDPYPHGLQFGDYDRSGLGDADDAVSIFVPYSGGIFDVTWEYDSVSGRYLRYIQSQPQVDLTEGSPQVAAENVVLLYVPYRPAPDVPGKGQTYNLEFTGGGQAVVFRDGKRIDCTWTTDGTHPPQFIDAFGNAVLLKPGKTWFQVPPNPEKMVVTTGHEEEDAAAAAAAESAANTDNSYQSADAADTD